MRWFASGKRGSLIDHFCLWGIFAVFCALLYLGWTADFREHGVPPWAASAYNFMNRFLPKWFPF